MRMSSIPRLMLAIAGLSLAAAVAGCGTVRYSQQPGKLPVPVFGFHGGLMRVAAASASAAWAVGFSGTALDEGTLMLHWDGTTWSRVTSPAVLDGARGVMTDVTVVSANDAWAVGEVYPSKPLLLRWDGTRWSQVPVVLPANCGPTAIAMSSHGGWAVGECTVAARLHPLILRWDGTGWHRVPAPVGPDGFTLTRVVVTPAGTAWASGLLQAPGRLPPHSEFMRWNGDAWQWAAFPIAGPATALTDMSAAPDGTAWAVGQELTMTSQPGVFRAVAPLAMRWTGLTWQAVRVPVNKSGLNGVTVAPGGTVWAVGGTDAGVLALRWTGGAWAGLPVPTGQYPAENGELTSVAFSSPAYGWAVGDEFVTGTGSHSGDWPLIVHWDGTTWN